MWRSAKALIVAGVLPGLSAVADDVTAANLIHYAECLGAGDQYARDAAVYGYDSTAQDAAAADAMTRMLAHPASPGEARLLRARREGRVTYAALGQALQGRMDGPAWDTFVAFSVRCEETRAHLTNAGLLPTP